MSRSRIFGDAALAAILLLAAVIWAVLSGGAAAASVHRTADPKRMVLRLSDLPTGFGRVSGRYVNNARAAWETVGIPLGDYLRWGRINGYEETFRRSSTVGLTEIQSQASTYKSTKGASESLHASFRAADKTKAVKHLSLNARLGYETRLYSYSTKSQGFNLIVYVVVWRYKTARAAVIGGGISGTVLPERVVAIAQKQQRRIAAELG